MPLISLCNSKLLAEVELLPWISQQPTTNTECPTCYRTRLAGGPLLRIATIRRTTDTILFIPHTTNVPLFKFRCNIFTGVRIIKEMPVGSELDTLYLSTAHRMHSTPHILRLENQF
jgi:hypothetical protein